MQKVTKAIIILTACYIVFGLYAFGIFLQQPLIQGETLTLQSTLEPFAYIILLTFGNFLIFKAVYSSRKKTDSFFNEQKLLIPTIVLLLMLSFGAGLHTAGQLIEETFINTSASNLHIDNFSYKVAYFLEEYPAHFLVAIAYLSLLYLLTKIERNRKLSIIKFHEQIIIVVCALMFGASFAVFNAEGNVAILVILLNIFFLVKFYLCFKQASQKIWTTPFSAYWVIGIITMTILGLYLGFTNGWFAQPTDIGIGS